MLDPNDVVRVRKDNKLENKGYVIVIRRNRKQLMKTIKSFNNTGSTVRIDVYSNKFASIGHNVSKMSEASMSDNNDDSDGGDVTINTGSGDQVDGHGVIANTPKKSILTYITANIPNTPTQHRYKAQHTTVTALHTLNNTVAKGFNQMAPLREQSL